MAVTRIVTSEYELSQNPEIKLFLKDDKVDRLYIYKDGHSFHIRTLREIIALRDAFNSATKIIAGIHDQANHG